MACAEIDLECRHPEQRANRRANFSGKIGEGRKIVARQRRGQRELTAGQLHPVAAIACKANDNSLALGRRDLASRLLVFKCGCHSFQPVLIMYVFVTIYA